MEYYDLIKPKFEQYLEHYGLRSTEIETEPGIVILSISDPNYVLTNETIEGIVANILRKGIELDYNKVELKREYIAGGVLIGFREVQNVVNSPGRRSEALRGQWRNPEAEV